MAADERVPNSRQVTCLSVGIRRRSAFRALTAAGIVLAVALGSQTASAGGDKRPILVSRADSVAGKSFEVLDVVRSQIDKPRMTETDKEVEERSSDHLVSKARELGADAVLGLHGLPAVPKVHSRWVSGVAVRFVEPGAIPSGGREPRIITVLPIEIPDSLGFIAKKRAWFARLVQDDAQRQTEARGYYAQRGDSAITDSSVLAAMSDSTWSATFGKWTGQVLCVRIVSLHGSDIIMHANVEATATAWLFSRMEGRVTWRSEGTGSASAWGQRTNMPEGLDQFFSAGEGCAATALDRTLTNLLQEIPSVSKGN
jgi:hypothetical protein